MPEIGPFVLPGLALLIIVVIFYVASRWVFDGTSGADNPEPSEGQSRKAKRRSGRRD